MLPCSKRSICIARRARAISARVSRVANFRLEIFFLLATLGWICPAKSFAFEEIMVSYAGPTVTFLPAEIARQRGFMREQNLDAKLLLTRSEEERAAPAHRHRDYTAETAR